MVIKVFGLIFYCLGMWVTDKLLANSFVDGMEEEYTRRTMFGEYDSDKIIRKLTNLLNVLVKILVPLFWPVVWLVSIILALRNLKREM